MAKISFVITRFMVANLPSISSCLSLQISHSFARFSAPSAREERNSSWLFRSDFCWSFCSRRIPTLQLYEPPHDKTNKMTCTQRRLRSAWSESSLGTRHFVSFVMRRLIWSKQRLNFSFLKLFQHLASDSNVYQPRWQENFKKWWTGF